MDGQDTGNRKNKMEKEGKIMIRKPQLNDKITQKTPIKATTEGLGSAREKAREGEPGPARGLSRERGLCQALSSTPSTQG